MRRELQGISPIAIFIFSFVLLAIGEIHAASGPVVMVDPRVSGAAPTESFSVNIMVVDVTDLYAWQFNLTFNPSMLEAVDVVEGPFLKQLRTTFMGPPNINATAGWVYAAAAFFDWEEAGASGSGVLATANIRVKTAGMTALHLSSETALVGYDGTLPVPMTYEAVDGVFGYPRDLAVIGLVASSSSVPAGELVTLDATVRNKGIVDEVFNVTVYRNSTAIDTRTDLSLGSEASTSVVFVWNTTGVVAGSYVMRAEVSVVSGENDTANNVFEDGIVTVQLVHDVAITGVTVSPSSVQSGDIVSINVTVLNKGSATESFSVAVSYDGTAIDSKEVTDLAPGAVETLTFTWKTENVAAGTYVLTATTSTISGETSTDDNVYSNVALEITSASFTLPIEWLAVIAVVVVVVLAFGIFLYMRRRSKKP